MISYLTGCVVFIEERYFILDVGGVGYHIRATTDTIRVLKKEKKHSIWTHLSVRENALDLYGFTEHGELLFFELLITISGIGPKTALSIMETSSIDTLRKAISSGDSSYLTDVSGIGKKNANKIILELRDKLSGGILNDTDTMLKEDADTIEALVALGYAQKEARATLKQVNETSPNSATKEKIKIALSLLGK